MSKVNLMECAEAIEDRLWDLADAFRELDFGEFIAAGNGYYVNGIATEIEGAAESVHILWREYEKWKAERREVNENLRV